MSKVFAGISQAEYTRLQEGLIHITILVASADGRIDQDEKDWAEKVARFRGHTMIEDELKDFYHEADEGFLERLEQCIKELPMDNQERIEVLSSKLAELNQVFPRIEDKWLRYKLYGSFISFAEHVAKASGGFLGWGSIGPVEKELMQLSMITPIEEP